MHARLIRETNTMCNVCKTAKVIGRPNLRLNVLVYTEIIAFFVCCLVKQLAVLTKVVFIVNLLRERRSGRRPRGEWLWETRMFHPHWGWFWPSGTHFFVFSLSSNCTFWCTSWTYDSWQQYQTTSAVDVFQAIDHLSNRWSLVSRHQMPELQHYTAYNGTGAKGNHKLTSYGWW